jgi:addiction module HigA family antidote
MSTREAAKRLGVTPTALGNVVAGTSAVSPEMALRLGKFFGNGPELWIGMQTDHDLWRAREALAPELAKIEPAPKEAA